MIKQRLKWAWTSESSLSNTSSNKLEEDFLEPLKQGCKMLAEMLAKKSLTSKSPLPNQAVCIMKR